MTAYYNSLTGLIINFDVKSQVAFHERDPQAAAGRSQEQDTRKAALRYSPTKGLVRRGEAFLLGPPVNLCHV